MSLLDKILGRRQQEWNHETDITIGQTKFRKFKVNDAVAKIPELASNPDLKCQSCAKQPLLVKYDLMAGAYRAGSPLDREVHRFFQAAENVLAVQCVSCSSIFCYGCASKPSAHTRCLNCSGKLEQVEIRPGPSIEQRKSTNQHPSTNWDATTPDAIARAVAVPETRENIIEIKKVVTGEVIGTVSGNSLYGAMLNGKELPGADFGGKSMIDAELRRANLRDANFAQANLEHATFEGADLQGASFRDAYLAKTNFTGCDLRQADLTGAILTQTTLLEVKHDRGTKWPEGFDLSTYEREMADAEDEMIRRLEQRGPR